MPFIQLVGWIILMGTVIFGGGQVFIPILDDMFVNTGLIETDRFYEIVGIANAFPGPYSGKIYTLFTYEIFGLWEALLINIIFAVLALIAIVIAVKTFDKLKTYKPFMNLTKYIKGTVVGILAYVGYTISSDYIFKDTKSISIGIAVVITNLVLFNYFPKKKIFVVIANIALALAVV